MDPEHWNMMMFSTFLINLVRSGVLDVALIYRLSFKVVKIWIWFSGKSISQQSFAITFMTKLFSSDLYVFWYVVSKIIKAFIEIKYHKLTAFVQPYQHWLPLKILDAVAIMMCYNDKNLPQPIVKWKLEKVISDKFWTSSLIANSLGFTIRLNILDLWKARFSVLR